MPHAASAGSFSFSWCRDKEIHRHADQREQHAHRDKGKRFRFQKSRDHHKDHTREDQRKSRSDPYDEGALLFLLFLFSK